MEETIQFKKQRELGAILTDTFKFIRLNWRTMFPLLLKIAGPALLLLIAAYIYYAQSLFGSLGFFQTFEDFGNFGTTTLISIVLLIISALVYYSLLNGVILHYIKSYTENGGIVSPEVVTEGVKRDFWKLIGTSFMVGIIAGFGMIFCLIPGIYFWVVLSTAYAVVVFEKKDVMDTISYCFNLIKNEWWLTFATLIVVFLLYYFIAMIFQVPQLVYFFIKGLALGSEISADPSSLFDWGYIIITAVGLIFQYLLYTIIVISSAFIYFNLHEKKYFTGTMETIDSIGEKPFDHF